MAYAQKSFRFWVSFYDIAIDMDDDNRLAFYDAIVDYVFKNRDSERTLKRKNLRDAYIGFKSVKTNLKTSKSRSQAGQNGNEIRWNKTPDESDVLRQDCDSFATIANESLIKSQIKSKSQSQTYRTPAACTKCGGVLQRTGVHKTRGGREQYMHVCAECGAEVWE